MLGSAIVIGVIGELLPDTPLPGARQARLEALAEGTAAKYLKERDLGALCRMETARLRRRLHATSSLTDCARGISTVKVVNAEVAYQGKQGDAHVVSVSDASGYVKVVRKDGAWRVAALTENLPARKFKR
jgi:hypothetical protein